MAAPGSHAAAAANRPCRQITDDYALGFPAPQASPAPAALEIQGIPGAGFLRIILYGGVPWQP